MSHAKQWATKLMQTPWRGHARGAASSVPSSPSVPTRLTSPVVALVSAASVLVAAPGVALAQVDPEPELPSPPLALEVPRVSGLAFKGQVLACSRGTWEGAIEHTLAWYRDGDLVVGRTAPKFRVGVADVGHSLVCAVTATNDVGWTSEDSAPVVVSRVPVALRIDSESRQHGPVLRFEGRVLTDGPRAEGAVELVREGAPGTRAPIGVRGGFVIEEPIWGLRPGRTDVVLRFLPRDPDLHQSTETRVRLTVTTPPTYPFPRSAEERPTTMFDALPTFWRGAGACATGCRPAGARNGWPLEPFDEQHGLRAGINERRDSGFHLGIDIQARAWAPVYAIQSGRAQVIQRYGSNARVQIGNFIYWHVRILVAEGEWVRAFEQPIGTVFRLHRHLHLSEVDAAGGYLNPLRPGGRVLAPWEDREPPVVGRPVLGSDGSFTVTAFDPQSFEERTSYVTPVLAPAALAWRLFDTRGRALTGLRWSLRGTRVLSDSLIPAVYTPDARRPGYACFAFEPLCVPHWRYKLGAAGELASTGRRGRIRLTVYAWDWRGNTTARDLWLGPTR